MACVERAERSRSETLSWDGGRCHGRSSRGVEIMMAWFVPPVVVPLLVFIIVAIVLVVRLFE
jgi:hypothetical protein